MKSYYTHFDITQRNTYYHYNYLVCRYLKKYDWFNEQLYDVLDILKKISTNDDKSHIEPYLLIYKHYLTKYEHIFNSNCTYIDLGCAPGGFITFATSIGMKGYGVTLKPDKNNKGLSLEPLKYVDTTKITYGDLLDYNFVKTLKYETVDFVNLGAVLYDDGIAGTPTLLFLNQLYVALHNLKKGGSIMFIEDAFTYISRFCSLVEIFLNNDCHIHCIPVQPSFKTTQIYILVENVDLTKIFNKIVTLFCRNYVPIVDNLFNLDVIFKSPNFNLKSFIECYYIKYHNNKKLFPILHLDVLNTSLINFEYLSYENFMFNFKTPLFNYSTEHIDIINKMRLQFLKDNNIPYDEKHNIVSNYKPKYDTYMAINKFLKKIVKTFNYLKYKT